MKCKKIFIAICLVFVLSVPVFAVDFIIGAKAGYYVWEPYLKDMGASGFSEMDEGTGVLYGPVFSVIFTPDISLSLAVLTGKQSTHWNANYTPHEGEYIAGTYYFESERTDVDTALSYRIMQNLKVFVGYKYQYIESTMNYTELRTDAAKDISEIGLMDGTMKTPSHGPALGIGYSLPFGKGFFAAANLSGLYMRGYFEMKNNYYYKYFGGLSPEPPEPTEKVKLDTRQYGMNFEPSIGYSAGNGLIFTLGFRYQWLRTEITEDFAPGEEVPDTDDYLYGVFVSVLYML